MAVKEKNIKEKEIKNQPYGVTFKGRDTATWGEDDVGIVAVDASECPEPGLCPQYVDRYRSPDDDEKIHLVIGSFRDRLCPRTLYNLFTKAANPHRMFVRIICQIELDSDKVDDADCWEMLCKTYNGKMSKTSSSPFDCEKFKSNVDLITIQASDAKGPCDARSKLSALIEHDYLNRNNGKHRLTPVAVTDYCMQTDSHMDFNHNFDVDLIDSFHKTENDRAVLSTYVASMEQTDEDPVEVPLLCMMHFTSTYRNWGTKFCRFLKKPKLTNIAWGAGLSFQKCHAELNVQYDPYLDNVFDGEEIGRGFRFFTHGYDVYTPDRVLVTHDYKGHQSNPNVHSWGHKKGESSSATRVEDIKEKNGDMSFLDRTNTLRDVITPKGTSRINVVLGIEDSSIQSRHKENVLGDDPEAYARVRYSKYGLGTIRTLDQAIEFSGFSPTERKMIGGNKCGNVKWVPYEFDTTLTTENMGDYDFGVEKTIRKYIFSENEENTSDTIRELEAAAGRQKNDDGNNNNKGFLPGNITSMILLLPAFTALMGIMKYRNRKKKKLKV